MWVVTCLRGTPSAKWSRPSPCRICTHRCRRKLLLSNEDLEASPELVNSDPYGGGWLIDLQVDAEALEKGFAELLDAEAYRGTLAE